jgi:hypothetical protein
MKHIHTILHTLVFFYMFLKIRFYFFMLQSWQFCIFYLQHILFWPTFIWLHLVIIPKFKELSNIKNVVNAFGDFLLRFFIFKGERIRNDYVWNCKPQTCIIMHNKTQMTFFLFKEVLSFSQGLFLDSRFKLIGIY